MVTNDVYIIMREAIAKAAEQSGKLYDKGQEPHYMALAVAVALRQAGYSITKEAFDA